VLPYFGWTVTGAVPDFSIATSRADFLDKSITPSCRVAPDR
jgi:hypothetical protein